jgi:penicillin-binding protein 2
VIQTPEERRPPITPQLAVRVAILGGVALALFAVVFFRLWFLQVLSGNEYLARAQSNRVRNIVVQAPRGAVVDRNGAVLVDNRASTVLQVEPPRMPHNAARRSAVYRRLARLIGSSTATRPCRVANRPVIHVTGVECEVERQHYAVPFSNVTVKADVPRPVFDYVYENRRQLPGVVPERIFLRHYPFHSLAAQLFGTVGEISPKELKFQHFRGVHQGTVVGQTGVEYSYDRYLRGRDGATRVSVDALGNAKGYLRQRPPVQGKTLRLSVDLGLQREGEIALKKGIAAANTNGNPAQAAAFAALDPRTGEVLAMGSNPSFDPNVFAKPIPTARYNALFGKSANYPQLDRAIQSAYPTGSTFKPITATAGLEAGTFTPDTVQDDPGQVKIGNIIFHNAGNAANGPVSLRRALQVSSDVFFYRLGAWMNNQRPAGGPIQTWAHRFGIGRPTGVDVPGEVSGNLPSPGWRAARNEQEVKCRKRNHGHACGLGDLRPWSIGDNVNFAVGQGDLLATPLQMAVAYSALENGGKVVKPHIGQQVEDSVGKVLQQIDPPPSRRIPIKPGTRQPILDGLHLAASAPGGTSADVFKGFPKPVYGKTGTAQHTGQADQSWYVAIVPDPVRPIVIAVTVEKGGFGAQAAAPAARLMLSQWFHVKKSFVTGTSHTR